MAMNVEDVYGAIGEAGFERLIAAFYRQIPDDAILGPMYRTSDIDQGGSETERMKAAEVRLRDFLIFRFGGPQRYLQTRGAPALRMRHVKFTVNQEARDRWVQLMDKALDEAALPAEATATIREFLGQVATFLINRPPG